MQLRKIFLAIVFLVLASAPVFAQTVVDIDIYADTTWTKAMSPILIQSNERGDTIRRLINGATLTIEPGVVVQVEKGMSFQIMSSCLRGFNSDTCYRDGEGKIKMPKLVAHGTATEPIIFTSKEPNPQAGDWGALIADAPNSELEWVEVRYAGAKGKRAAVEINNSLFQNNLITNSGLAQYAVYASSQTIEGSVIRDGAAAGIFCDHSCQLLSNVIEGNAGDAVAVDLKVPTKISGNLIFKNGGYAIRSDSIYSQPVTIENNFFRENSGGVYFQRSCDGLKINSNNFLKNTNFAIKSDINNYVGQIYPATGNWFGIDTGSQKTAGQFFVSSDYDASKFSATDLAFAIDGSSEAARIYRDYLSENNLTDNFFTAKVSRTATSGKENLPGALLQYSLTLENKTTSARDAQIAISVPSDQGLLLCSAQPASADFGYTLATACSTTLASSLTFKNNQLVWSPTGIPALGEKTLFFVMMTNPTTTNPALPRIDLSGKPFPYTLGTKVTLSVSGGNAAAPTSSPVTTPVAVQKAATPTVQNSAPAPVAGAIATGTVTRQMLNGVLTYLLKTSDGKYYVLFNKDKWRDIDNFTKSADKAKKIAVFGEFTYKNGRPSAIKFSRFEILN